jgi:hypothetical protein
MNSKERRLELTTKFMKMGQALMEEGDDCNDITISQLGTMLIFLGGLAFDENDVNKFSELVSMFSAKKLFDNLDENDSSFIRDMKNKADRGSYDDIIKSIEGLSDNGFNDNDDYYEDDEDYEDDDK